MADQGSGSVILRKGKRELVVGVLNFEDIKVTPAKGQRPQQPNAFVAVSAADRREPMQLTFETTADGKKRVAISSPPAAHDLSRTTEQQMYRPLGVIGRSLKKVVPILSANKNAQVTPETATAQTDAELNKKPQDEETSRRIIMGHRREVVEAAAPLLPKGLRKVTPEATGAGQPVVAASEPKSGLKVSVSGLTSATATGTFPVGQTTVAGQVGYKKDEGGVVGGVKAGRSVEGGKVNVEVDYGGQKMDVGINAASNPFKLGGGRSRFKGTVQGGYNTGTGGNAEVLFTINPKKKEKKAEG